MNKLESIIAEVIQRMQPILEDEHPEYPWDPKNLEGNVTDSIMFEVDALIPSKPSRELIVQLVSERPDLLTENLLRAIAEEYNINAVGVVYGSIGTKIQELEARLRSATSAPGR